MTVQSLGAPNVSRVESVPTSWSSGPIWLAEASCSSAGPSVGVAVVSGAAGSEVTGVCVAGSADVVVSVSPCGLQAPRKTTATAAARVFLIAMVTKGIGRFRIEKPEVTLPERRRGDCEMLP